MLDWRAARRQFGYPAASLWRYVTLIGKKDLTLTSVARRSLFTYIRATAASPVRFGAFESDLLLGRMHTNEPQTSFAAGHPQSARMPSNEYLVAEIAEAPAAEIVDQVGEDAQQRAQSVRSAFRQRR